MKKVSIIMLAYNKLAYTKLTVDSLYKYTSHINFEFISVNNGSSDGTKEYLDSLQNDKKINFEENVGGDRAFNEALKYAEGEYTVFLNNDLILTEKWLDNLIEVMESDPKIGVCVPVCNSSSNYQTVPLEYYDTVKLQEVAKDYNKSDSKKWEERLRLMLYAAIFRTNELKDLGGLDEIYSPGGFDDDDLTCRYRRAGFKLILAKDTYIHHYGSVTIGESYASILAKNRGIFKIKFGYDSWEGNTLDFNFLNNIKCIIETDINILGVGRNCGATILQLKNGLKSLGSRKTELDYFSLESKYTIDLKTICNNVYFGEINEIESKIRDKKYNYIFLDDIIFGVSKLKDFMKLIDKLVEDRTIIVFIAKNFKLNNEEDCSRDNIEKIVENYKYRLDKVIMADRGEEYYFLEK